MPTKPSTKTREYFVHDNGGRPYKVSVVNKTAIIHKLIYNNTIKREYEPILQFECEHIFIGHSPKNPMTLFSGGYGPKYDGNTILLQLKSNGYVYIGSVIMLIRTDSEIVKYVSPVGNSDVPYPYAIDKDNNVYLFIENVVLTHKSFENNNNKLKLFSDEFNPYDTYYQTRSICEYKDNCFFIGAEPYSFNYNPDPAHKYDSLTHIEGRPQKLYLKTSNRKMILTKPSFIRIMNEFAVKKGYVPLKHLIISHTE
jgi:hypothetical protein